MKYSRTLSSSRILLLLIRERFVIHDAQLQL